MDLAEQLDPEEWHRILDRFFAILTEGVHLEPELFSLRHLVALDQLSSIPAALLLLPKRP
jgi:hypothetical protein